MSGGLVAATAVAGIVAYIVLATITRSRSIRARGASLAREGGLAAAVPYFLPVPYVVMALQPGPALDLPGPLRWLGLALVVGGIGFSMWGALTLGRHFDMEVEVHSGHEVVRRGPYALVRHPVYSGLAVHLLGACLATGNLLLLAGTVFLALPALYLRASIEERLLRSSLGSAYDAYARDVGMLFPFFGTVPRR